MISIVLVVVSCTGPRPSATVPGTMSAQEISEWIRERQFTFKATTAVPSIGQPQYLTSEYDIQMAPDSLISYLPYFGRAYRAPVDPSQGGIRFTSTDFEYVAEKENEGWSIMVRPRDNTEVQQLFFNVSASGMATLHVISTFRQPIIFNGHVAPRKKAKAF